MASSGSFKTSYYKNLCLMLSWSIVQPQSIENNSTTIAWSLQGYRTDGATGMITCGGFKVVIDGTTVYSKSTDYRVNVYNGTVVASGTHTISHNTDGTKSFSASAEAGIYYYEVNASGSGTFTLDTIARASTPTVSASSVVMLNKVTVTTNRKSSSFTHDLTYSFGGSTGTIATGVGASYEWTVPDLVSNISGKTSGTCTITCKTKNGSTVVGTKTVTLTLTIPAKSAVSASATTVQMGKSVTINTNRKSSGYTHTITYTIGTNSGTIATGLEAAKSWTPPKSLAAYTGNKTSATCTITCATYTGSTLVGSTTTTITLTVPNATVPTLSVSAVNMGDKITISMPKEADVYTHDLTYSLMVPGSSTVVASGTIAAGVSSDYPWTVPLTLAANIPSSPKGKITITCTTRFANSTTVVGTQPVSFEAIVPDNSTTKPRVTMELTPVSSLPSTFSDVYVSGKSKVKISYAASSDYSTISSYKTEVKGNSGTGNPYTSALLTNSGTVSITGKVTDARGYVTTTTDDIEVIPYSKPRIIPGEKQSNVVCVRCNSDGKADPGGVYLLIKLGRKYEKVVSGGVQKNYCKLSYRWKTDAQSESMYSEPVELLAKTTATDYIDTTANPLSGIVTSNTTAYNIQIIAEDDIGERDTVTVTVPTAFVTFHSPVGGHGFTLGGYHDPNKYDVFNCIFDAEFEGDVSGKVYGLGALPMIPENSDFNTYKSFGTYAVTQNVKAETIANMPVQKAGTLRVWSANGSGMTTGTYVYILQEFIVYDNSATYRRAMIMENAAWKYEMWKVTDGVDTVIEERSANGWYWRKFGNGTAECWTRVTQTVDVSTAWGSLFYGTCKVVTFPLTFAEVPTCNINAEYSVAGNPSAMLASNGRTTTTQAPNVLLVRPSANTAVDCVVVYHAVGRWK